MGVPMSDCCFASRFCSTGHKVGEELPKPNETGAGSDGMLV